MQAASSLLVHVLAFDTGALRVDLFRYPLRFEHAPVTARGADELGDETMFVRVRDGSGAEGWGEGCPDTYYGEIPGTVAGALPHLARAAAPALERAVAAAGGLEGLVGRAADGLAPVSDAMDVALGGNGTAKAALESALHDLLARRAGRSLRDWLGAPRTLPPTDATLWIASPAEMAERAAAYAHHPAMKLKVGVGGEEEVLRRVRGAYGGPLRLDANCGWDLRRALELLPAMESAGVELIEQPFPAHRLGDMAALAAATEIPVIADEDCVVLADIERVAGHVDGVNLKVVKVGGIGPLLRGLRRAEELGLRRMFGCMTETLLGTAAAAAVAGPAEFLDLDGPLGSIGDPWEGLELGADCRWQLDDRRPGSGVALRLPPPA
jgi:L-alanine-DL-glutamate epimerase-like enolase superfamily enzyme